MALTKVNWFLNIILLVSVVFVSFLLMGDELVSTTPGTLDSDSFTYVSEYRTYLSDAGLENISNTDTQALKDDKILSDEEGGFSVSDTLANINYGVSRMQKISNNLKLVYNIPTLMILTTGLPLGAMDHVINIVGWLLFAAMVIVFIRLARGS